MANSTTHIDGIVQSQGSQDLTANAVFDAGSPAVTYGRRASTTSGTTRGYYGGKVLISGTVTEIANGTVALTPSATNYVEAHPDTGAVSKNTTAFTAGYLPLYTIVAGASSITSYTAVFTPVAWSLGLPPTSTSGCFFASASAATAAITALSSFSPSQSTSF